MKTISNTKMKRIILYSAVSFLLLLIFASCEKEVYFDDSLLIGKWQSGTLFDKYFANGTGYSWDEGEDIYEEEAQDFTWTLSGAELIRNEQMEIGDVEITKIYTITELTAEVLRYRDDFGRSYTFNRVDD